MLQRVPRKSHCERLKPAILTLVSRNSAHKKVTNLRFAKSLIKEKNPREIHLLTFPRFISYACCDWLLPYNRCSDVTNTTLHKVYQTGQGETDSEEAANDLRLLRIVQEDKLCSFARFPFSADDHGKGNRNSNPFLWSVILVKYRDNQFFSMIYLLYSFHRWVNSYMLEFHIFSQQIAKIATTIVRFTSLTARTTLIKVLSANTARRRVTFVLKVTSLFFYHWNVFPPHSRYLRSELCSSQGRLCTKHLPIKTFENWRWLWNLFRIFFSLVKSHLIMSS